MMLLSSFPSYLNDVVIKPLHFQQYFSYMYIVEVLKRVLNLEDIFEERDFKLGVNYWVDGSLRVEIFQKRIIGVMFVKITSITM
jgi:hypothetical protein